MTVDPEVGAAALDARARRGEARARPSAAVDAALDASCAARRRDRRQPDAGHDRRAPRPGVTTGEWAGALREVFGEYRAPTGVVRRGRRRPRPAPSSPRVRERVGAHRRGARRPAAAAGRQARASTATPTAPSRSPCAPATPASRSSTRASGSRRSRSSRRPSPRTSHCVGLSILSGSHMELVPEVLDGLREAGRRRRPGRRRRDHPRGRRRGAARRRASPRSTRPRTSGSTRSWAGSST